MSKLLAPMYVLFATVLAGCISSGSTDPLPVAPLAAVQLKDNIYQLKFKAIEEAIDSCMTRRGFKYLRYEYIAPAFQASDRRWGLLDPAVAAERGYHLTKPVEDSDAKAKALGIAQGDFRGTMSAQERNAYEMALTGLAADAKKPLPLIPTKLPSGKVGQADVGAAGGSCRFEALASLPGRNLVTVEQEAALRDQIQILAGEADKRAEGSAPFRAAAKNWAACFLSKGFTAANPLDALEKYLSPSATPSKEELAAASADVACKASSDFWATWNISLEDGWQKVARSRRGDVEAVAAFQAELASSLRP